MLAAAASAAPTTTVRIQWASHGLESEAALLFSSLRQQWGSVSAGFNSMVQLKADTPYERAEYGSFSQKEITSHLLKTKINKHDWLVAVEAICQTSNICRETAAEIFDVLDTHQTKEITHAQLYAGYKGAGMLACGGGGIPLSPRLKGLNKIKGSKLTRFHHLPSGADRIPEHRRRKVRSLGELLDWHARVSSSASAPFQGIGTHNGFGWEVTVSNTDMVSKDSDTPLVTPRTNSSHCTTPRSAAGSRLTTPRDENPNAAALRASHDYSARSSLSALPPRPATAATAPASAVAQTLTSAATSAGAAQLFREPRIGEEADASSPLESASESTAKRMRRQTGQPHAHLLAHKDPK